MFLLPRMLLFWFFITIIIYLRDTTTLAQPRLIAHACENAANYTANSTYEVNVDITRSTLLTTNSSFGFYNFSTGTGDDRVNSIALCRGDVEPSLCQRCVNDSIARLRLLCPNKKEAIGYYDECMLKYSGNTPMDFYQPYENDQFVTDVDRFNGVLRPLLDKLRGDAAAGGPLLKFATGNTTGPGIPRIYALVQCTPDLSQLQCSDCLENAINRSLSEFSGKVGVRALVPLCNYRYEIRRFFNGSTLAISPPPSGSVSPPPQNPGSTATNSSFNRKKRGRLAIIITFSLSAGLALLGLIFWGKRKMRSDADRQGRPIKFIDKDHGSETSIEVPFFSLFRVSMATNNFSVDNKLGEGGFGPVYKGVLEDEQEIAVKRLSKFSRQGLDEFKNEVICIAKLQHRNLVKLLGYCIQGDEIMLIYEYMPNNSLDSFIFDERRKSLLDWPRRFQIIHGIARGLLYLHQDSRLRVVHRDLKAGNILLDHNMTPKISDFGLARMFKEHESEANTLRVVGTLGYISPEYAANGLFSVKSDIFSFGVLVLEIVSGKKNRGIVSEDHHHNLIGHAWRLHREDKSLDLIDASFGNSYSVSEVLRSIHIGLLCVQQLAEDRPSAPSVISMLGGESSLPSPKRPGFFIQGSETVSTIVSSSPPSVNGVTLSQIEGR